MCIRDRIKTARKIAGKRQTRWFRSTHSTLPRRPSPGVSSYRAESTVNNQKGALVSPSWSPDALHASGRGPSASGERGSGTKPCTYPSQRHERLWNKVIRWVCKNVPYSGAVARQSPSLASSRMRKQIPSLRVQALFSWQHSFVASWRTRQLSATMNLMPLTNASEPRPPIGCLLYTSPSPRDS